MKFENTDVWGFDHAIRGMRNPKNSWERSDSEFGIGDTLYGARIQNAAQRVCDAWAKSYGYSDKSDAKALDDFNHLRYEWLGINGIFGGKTYEDRYSEYTFIGPNDMKLMQQLIRSGNEHRKFMRQIMVSVDITAPLYWWKEMDQYKVGTTTNSTSTMHKLASTPINIDCFETDDIHKISFDKVSGLIDYLEWLRFTYVQTKDKDYWKELIRWLPESWLQKRTVTMSYENLLAMCSVGQRRFHKLNEWSGKDKPDVPNFIAWARTLPYAQELIFLDELDKEKE